MSPAPEVLAPPESRVLAARYRRLSLGILSVVALIAFEGMAVATAMPVAVRDLRGLPLYAWGFSGFFAASLFGMVVAGELSDSRGPRLPLLTGVAAFGAGLLLAGAAVTMGTFVAARAVQGLGAGLVIVALYVLVARCYPESLRPRVFALMSSAWVIPSIVGPPVAGWLADHASWRLVFLAIAPLVVPALVLLLPWLRRGTDGADPRTDMPPVRRTGRKRRALAAAVGVAALQYAGQHLSWQFSWQSVVVAVVAVLLLVPSVPPLLPAGTLRGRRGLPTVVAMRGVLAGSFFGAEAFIPLMLVTERSMSTTLAGLSLTGAAFGWAAGSWWQGRPRLRAPRWRLVQVGSAVVTLAIAAVAVAVWDGVPPSLAGLAWTTSGLGMGLAVSSVSVLLLELSPREEQGANSAAVQISDALGSIVFVGLGGVVYAALHTAAGQDAVAFIGIFTVMAALALVGTLLASRVRP
jgi:MFS family permease